MSKFCSTFAPAFEKTGVFGEWRSPVAQRSGGPEVACSNHVSPTKSKDNLLNFRRLFSFCSVFCSVFILSPYLLTRTRVRIAREVHHHQRITKYDAKVLLFCDIYKFFGVKAFEKFIF